MKSTAENVSFTDEDLSDLRDLAWSLTDLYHDLKGAGLIFIKINDPLISEPLSHEEFMATSRVVIGSTVISLCKLNELHKRYGKLINKYFNNEIGLALKGIVQRVKQRDFLDYRNSYLAHPLEKKKGGSGKLSPAPFEELKEKLDKILEFNRYNTPKEAVESHLEWINHQDSKDSVMQLLKIMITQANQDLNLGKRT